MSTTDKVDVVVIGAGVIGASSAFHLAERGLSVAVVEARDGYAEGSTGLSFASVRAQWSDPLNIEISWRSLQRWRDFKGTYGLDVGYLPNGYLMLFPERLWAKQLEAVELQRSYGVPVEVLGIADAQKLSQFDPTGLAGATWGPADGQVDPHGATGAYLALARKHGARVSYKWPVDRIECLSDGSWLVGSGTRAVIGQYVVNAAGGWAGEIADLGGFEVPVVHSRRNVFATGEGVTTKTLPLTIDLETGTYFRSEGSRILFGGARPGEPDGYNTALDWDWLEGLVASSCERFPWMLDVPLDKSASWAGTYENTPDYTAIVGPEPDAPTWVNACGLSGHGLMQAPEIGRLVCLQITRGEMPGYDTTRLSVARFRGAERLQPSESLVF